MEAELRILGRSADMQLTASTGYVGARTVGKNGKVCYRNAVLAPEYGSVGHGKVVLLKIPPSSFPEFAKEIARPVF